jgi:nitrilase
VRGEHEFSSPLRFGCPRRTDPRSEFPGVSIYQLVQEANAIRIRCQAHAFEGKLFVVASTRLIDEECISANCAAPEDRALLQSTDFALSGIFGLDGEAVGDLLVDEEGLVFGHIDLERRLTGKIIHDIAGHYNQPAILSLHLDVRKQRHLRYCCGQQDLVENSDDQSKTPL